ncbi:ATP-binding protein [Actinomadura sp. PM05-2]|uniref:ATP-binding protein n=2 Tax=Actinomadura parmotrematis TaxID=2864039 RepID=A0ABS7G3C7_9ACTN|nr:ATP-binding protein [Actinomadura parmotrematis]
MAAVARGEEPGPSAPPYDLSSFFPPGNILRTHLGAAWHSRATAGAGSRPTLVLVGGYAGSGKTEFARFLSEFSGWAFLDKDALTRRMTERLLLSLTGDPHDRHTDTYRAEVRPLEYKTLITAALANVECGVSLILAAPFLAELHDRAWLTRLTHRCQAKGVEVAPVWIHSDINTMHDYLEHRAAARDGWKLTHWDQYADTIDPDAVPDQAHTIDNRHGAALSLADQTRRALTKLMP